IDDVFLYDAAVEGEKRPFPKKVHFTGWVDTGKQGKEWPGTFEIALNKGFYWHAAKAVADKEEAELLVVRLHLRGLRPLGENTHLTFRHHLTGADEIHVALRDAERKKSFVAKGEVKEKGKWAEMTLDLGAKKFFPQADELYFRVR